jgi:hypothetical protein
MNTCSLTSVWVSGVFQSLATEETEHRYVFAELLADHDRAVTAGIVDNLLGRCREGAPHGVNAGLLIVVDKLVSDGMPS